MANVATAPTEGPRRPGAARTTRGGVFFTPRVDIFETDKELTLFADLPGVRPEDVTCATRMANCCCTAASSRRQGKQTPLLQEYEEGDFYRSFTIHESIDAGRISAECKNGVLTVHLPKAEAVKPRQISVKGG